MTAVAVVWWGGPSGDDTRHNVECFDRAGYDVVPSGPQIPRWTDFVFTPIPEPKLHTHPSVLQLGGYGHSVFMPPASMAPELPTVAGMADVVTVLDPSLAREIEAGVEDLTVETARVIPNATPPVTIPQRQSPDEGPFRVFVPTVDGFDGLKEMNRVAEAARIVHDETGGDTQFVLPIKSETAFRAPLEWVETDGLRVIPHQDYGDVLHDWYPSADVVAPFSAAEVQPQTVFEGFLSGKPVVVDEIADLQTIPKEQLYQAQESFGIEWQAFDEEWGDVYHEGAGEHYLQASTAEGLAEQVLDLYSDVEKRERIGHAGWQWIDEWWDPQERGRAIVDSLESELEVEL